jgi:hypothetical protein
MEHYRRQECHEEEYQRIPYDTSTRLKKSKVTATISSVLWYSAQKSKVRFLTVICLKPKQFIMMEKNRLKTRPKSDKQGTTIIVKTCVLRKWLL